MRNRVPLFICALAVALFGAAVGTQAQDIKLVTRMSANGQQVSEATTYIKGARKRMEQKMSAPGMDERMARMMPQVAQVFQCDKRRMLQINDRAKKYTVTQLDEDGSPVTDVSGAGNDEGGAAASAGTRRGAVVQYTTTVTDTGRRQEMFGLKARYLKLVTDVVPAPGACTPKAHYEQEGWYADFQAEMYCSSRNAAAPAQRPARSGCQDIIRYKTVGTASMGFPLSVTTTTTDENGRQTSMKQEVVDLKTGPLDAALFDVPAGYTQASGAQELYSMPSSAEMAAAMSGHESSGGRSDAGEETNSGGEAGSEAKSEGTVRIGVAVINDRSGRLGSTANLRQRLIDDLDGSELDAVSLNADSPDGIAAEARAKQCDFILYTDIASIKQSKAGKVGGLLGRAAGVGSGGADRSESRVEFRLIPVGGSAPRLTANATAKEEGDEQSVLAALTQAAQRVREEALRK